MILHRQKLKGLGRHFADRELVIDYDDLPEGLIAFTGAKGEGKTTALECSAVATLFRRSPYYGSLGRPAFSGYVSPGVRDAMSEIEFSLNGNRYRVLVQCDPLADGGKGKTEQYVFEDGRPLAGPKVGDCDLILRKILPDERLFLSTVFAAQGGPMSVLKMTKGERKDLVITSLLELGELQEYSDQATRKGKDLGVTLQAIERTMLDLQRRAETAKTIRETLVAARKAVTEKAKVRDDARGREEAARKAAENTRAALHEAQVRAEAAETERRRREEDLQRVKERAAELLKRHQELKAVIEETAEIRTAPRELLELEEKIAKVRQEKEESAAVLHALEIEASKAQAEIQTLLSEEKRLVPELARARETAEAAADIIRIDEAYTECRQGWRPLNERVAQAEAANRRRHVLEEKRTGLGAQVKTLEERSRGVCEICPLGKGLAELRADLVAADEEWNRLEQDSTDEGLAAVRGKLAALETRGQELKARRTALAEKVATATDPVALEKELQNVRQSLQQARRGADLEKTIGGHRKIVRELEGRLSDLEAKKVVLQAKAERAKLAEKAETEFELLVEQARKLDEERDEIRRRKVPEVGDTRKLEAALDKAEETLASATLELSSAESAHSEQAMAVSHLEGELSGFGDAEGELERAKKRLSELSGLVSDWTLLGKSLGRDGVQSLEIDAAGPGVTALVNDLLLASDGPRFSARIETIAPKKKAGETKEVFDIVVIDSEAGREGTAFSGGENVIIEEALRLGFGLHHKQKAKVALQTLWRDEFAGGLDPLSADRYVAMLRRVLAIGGFHHCLFITHSEAVAAQADARIHFQSGEIRIEA